MVQALNKLLFPSLSFTDPLQVLDDEQEATSKASFSVPLIFLIPFSERLNLQTDFITHFQRFPAGEEQLGPAQTTAQKLKARTTSQPGAAPALLPCPLHAAAPRRQPQPLQELDSRPCSGLHNTSLGEQVLNEDIKAIFTLGNYLSQGYDQKKKISLQPSIYSPHSVACIFMHKTP